jgi:hypothetical protein
MLMFMGLWFGAIQSILMSDHYFVYLPHLKFRK